MNRVIKDIIFIIILFIAVQLIIQVLSMVTALLPVIMDTLKQHPDKVADTFRQNATSGTMALPLSISTLISSILTVLLLKKCNYVSFNCPAPGKRALLFQILALCIPLIFSAIFVMNVVTEMLCLPDHNEQLFLAISQTGIWGGLAIVVAGPVCEEVTFRGAVEGLLLKNSSPWVAVSVSALLFGLIHMNPVQIPFAFVLGLLLGWLYYKTRSLVPSILAHILNNATGFITMIVAGNSSGTIKQTLGPAFTYTLSAFCIILFIILLVCVNKKAENYTR